MLLHTENMPVLGASIWFIWKAKGIVRWLDDDEMRGIFLSTVSLFLFYFIFMHNREWHQVQETK